MVVRKYTYAPLLVFQVLMIVLYCIFCKYEGGIKEVNLKGFEDTHVMIFIGFGFLMTFLKRYSYSALGFNWLLAALTIQWALLCQSFFEMKDGKIYINKKTIIEADIMSATVLITFGALLGVASGLQLALIAIIETVIGSLNLWLCEHVFKISDVGGSIAIHAFGAYFGLGAGFALRKSFKKLTPPQPAPAPPPSGAIATVSSYLSGSSTPPPGDEKHSLNGPSYASDVTAMIGSIFLWIYWPSFNSALTSTDAQYERAVINTYLSLAAATVTTFIVSSSLSPHGTGKFDMVHIQNSTLAGGVAVGAVCNMMIGPGVAIAIGVISGVISVFGYRFLTPWLEKKGFLDTCGVNNLHGMPGVLSGLLSVIFAALATHDTYVKADSTESEIGDIFEAIGEGRSAGNQALFQLIALVTTLVLAFVTGFIAGLLSKWKFLLPVKEKDRYNDEVNWDELP